MEDTVFQSYDGYKLLKLSNKEIERLQVYGLKPLNL